MHILYENMVVEWLLPESDSIRMSVVRIPPGERFSICPNGARRTCAIVQVTSPMFTKYILEVARPDDWSISTLILSPINHVHLDAIEKSIKYLLNGLVQKSGHWDQSILNRCFVMKIDKLKHYKSDSNIDWALKISNKFT